jgi:hypothetical protein
MGEAEKKLGAREALSAWARAQPRPSGIRLALHRVYVDTAGLRPAEGYVELITGRPETKASHSRSACEVTSRLWEGTEQG